MKFARGTTQVAGITFSIFTDFNLRGQTAINHATGEERIIKLNGYVRNELSVRKAIAAAFDLPTFRRK